MPASNNHPRPRFLLLTIGLLISACSGGGSGKDAGVLCAFMPRVGGDTTVGAGDNVENQAAASDGNLSTFATIRSDPTSGSPQGTSTLTDRSTQRTGGTNAGVFITPAAAGAYALSTFLQGVPQESGPLTMTSTDNRTPATSYYSIQTTKPFDEIQLSVSGTNEDTLVYEFCSAASMR